MHGMFANCYDLVDLILGTSFTTANVTDMHDMFKNDFHLLDFDMSGFNTTNVINMESMFRSCHQLKNMDLSNFDFSNVLDASRMFEDTRGITTTINLNFSSSTIYASMFFDSAIYECQITLNYTSELELMVDQIIATKSENSNVLKGVLI